MKLHVSYNTRCKLDYILMRGTVRGNKRGDMQRDGESSKKNLPALNKN